MDCFLAKVKSSPQNSNDFHEFMGTWIAKKVMNCFQHSQAFAKIIHENSCNK